MKTILRTALYISAFPAFAPLRRGRQFLLRLAVALCVGGSISAFSQGSLTPPGIPAPTMKTLDQIEARTPISTLPFNIGVSGSYYFTKNLSVSSGTAITIQVTGVTLDLNGFTISSTSSGAAGAAILLAPGSSDITILNGHIRGGVTFSGGTYSGSGFASGITYLFNAPFNVRVQGVSVSGCLIDGINLVAGNSNVVRECNVQTAGGNGIVADTISDSTANQCGTNGINGNAVQNCSAMVTGSGAIAVQGWTVNNCYGYASYASSTTNTYGIYAAGVATNCYGKATAQGSAGVFAATATNCYGYNTDGSGLKATHCAMNSFGYSTNGVGLDGNYVINCFGQTGSGNGLNAFTAIGGFGANFTIHRYLTGIGPDS